MTNQRIEQLRSMEISAIEVVTAYTQLLECIDDPKLWSCFEPRALFLKGRLDHLRTLVCAELSVSAPTPVGLRAPARQLTLSAEASPHETTAKTPAT